MLHTIYYVVPGWQGLHGVASVADSSPVNGVTPDVSTFLLRLSRTVRDNLAPRAGPGFLEDQLYSLSSILKILGTVAVTIDAENEADVLDLQRVLTEISAPDAAGTDTDSTDTGSDPMHPRAALARRIRAESLLNDPDARVSRVVHGYLERDLARPYVGLLGPSPAAPASLSSLAASEFTVEEDAARGRLLAVLAERLAQPESASPADVEFEAEAAGGYAAETRQVRVRSGPQSQSYIVRLQWPHNLMSKLARTVDIQAAAISVVASAGMAVPGVVLVEPDPDVVGTPFIVSEFVPGYVPTPWTADGRAFTDRLRPGHKQEFVAELVLMHSIGGRAHRLAPLVEGSTPLEHQRNRLAHLDELYHEVALRPDPVVEEVLAYLRDELPSPDDLVIVHGDYRPGNIIYDQETLHRRAVIDWDGVHLGNYHEDIGQILAWPFRDASGLACGLFEDTELLELYEQLSGRALRRPDTHYYQVAATFRRYIGFCVLARSWLDGGGDVRMARAWLALRNDRVELAKLLGITVPRG
jgi:aminoglycoside phosphotransferase (APT) family kinase protein